MESSWVRNVFELGWLNAGWNKMARLLGPYSDHIYITDLVRSGIVTAAVFRPISGTWFIEDGWAVVGDNHFPYGFPVAGP